MATYLTKDDSSAEMDKHASTAGWAAVEGDYGAESDLHRKLSTRHLTMIALGSSIGMGLWLGSGTSLANGGPAAIFIGYVLSGTMVWSVAHSIGEMAVLYPLPSAFVQWSTIFVSPAVGFTIGWAYWFNYWISIANELQGVVTVLSFWTDKVPTAAWISIFWVVIILINIWAVTFFGEVEVVSSLIKFSWIFVVIISLIGTSPSPVSSCGGTNRNSGVGGRRPPRRSHWVPILERRALHSRLQRLSVGPAHMHLRHVRLGKLRVGGDGDEEPAQGGPPRGWVDLATPVPVLHCGVADDHDHG